MAAANSTRKVYFSVVEDVISNVREAFVDEGVDEQVLQELKQLWENKLTSSRALDPPEPEQIQGNIPYSIMQPQTSQSSVPQTRTMQHQMPVPVQISTDRQISNAASMAFAAQGTLLPQHIQAIINMNPGAQITLQQTASGHYIVQTLQPGGVPQSQLLNIPHHIVQTPTGHLQVQNHNIPQYDGATDVVDDQQSNISCTEDGHSTWAISAEGLGTVDCIELEFNTSTAMTKRLKRDLKNRRKNRVPQLDGNHDTSSSEDDYDDDDEANDDDDKAEDEDGEGAEEEPLNSEDDVTEDDPSEVFDTDNVVVCQFEKISRNKNKWKFNLKDGIMNLDGKDHVFQRSSGEADW